MVSKKLLRLSPLNSNGCATITVTPLRFSSHLADDATQKLEATDPNGPADANLCFEASLACITTSRLLRIGHTFFLQRLPAPPPFLRSRAFWVPQINRDSIPPCCVISVADRAIERLLSHTTPPPLPPPSVSVSLLLSFPPSSHSICIPSSYHPVPYSP